MGIAHLVIRSHVYPYAAFRRSMKDLSAESKNYSEGCERMLRVEVGVAVDSSIVLTFRDPSIMPCTLSEKVVLCLTAEKGRKTRYRACGPVSESCESLRLSPFPSRSSYGFIKESNV
jgi:hypothetical protein